MYLTVLKAKLHQARVTLTELEYEGSCAIDGHLLNEAGIHEYEQIQIYNLSNGNRFTTYAIQGESGSGMISVNGAAAHQCNPGDRIIICSYLQIQQDQINHFKPKLVYLNEENRVTHVGERIPVQLASCKKADLI